MAYDIESTLGLDASAFSSSMSQAIDQVTEYTAGMKGLIGQVANFQTAINRGVVNTFEKVAGANKNAVGAAAGYEQQLSELAATQKLVFSGSDSLSKATLKLARDFPVGMRGALDVTRSLRSVGDVSASSAKLMTQMGAAAGESASSMAQLFIPLQRTFGGSNLKTMQGMSDSLTTITQQYGASASAALGFAKAISPLAATVGVSETKILGLSTAFARLGEDGYPAANAFNKVLRDFDLAARGGADTLGNYANALGITSKELKDLYKDDPTEAMIQFFEALEKQGDGAITTLERLGLDGPRTMKSLLAVTRDGSLRQIVKDSTEAYGNGSTAEGASEAFKGLNDQLSTLGEKTKQTVANVGKPMAELARNILVPLNSLAEAINKLTSNEFVQWLLKVGIALKAIKLIGNPLLAMAGAQALMRGPLAPAIGGAIAGFRGVDLANPASVAAMTAGRSRLRTSDRYVQTAADRVQQAGGQSIYTTGGATAPPRGGQHRAGSAPWATTGLFGGGSGSTGRHAAPAASATSRASQAATAATAAAMTAPGVLRGNAGGRPFTGGAQAGARLGSLLGGGAAAAPGALRRGLLTARDALAVGVRMGYGNVFAAAMPEPGESRTSMTRTRKITDRIMGTTGGTTPAGDQLRASLGNIAKRLREGNLDVKSALDESKKAYGKYNAAVTTAADRIKAPVARAVAGSVVAGGSYAGTAAARGAMGAGSLLASGAMSLGSVLTANPLVASAAVAGGAGYLAYRSIKQGKEGEEKAEGQSKDIYSELNELANRMGVASEGLVGFTSAIKNATDELLREAKGKSPEEAVKVSQEDVQIATSPSFEQKSNLGEREKALLAAGTDGDKAFAASLTARYGGNLNPQALTQIKLDLLDETGGDSKRVEKILADVVATQKNGGSAFSADTSEVVSGVVDWVNRIPTSLDMADVGEAQDRFADLVTYIGDMEIDARKIGGDPLASKVKVSAVDEIGDEYESLREPIKPEARKTVGLVSGATKEETDSAFDIYGLVQDGRSGDTIRRELAKAGATEDQIAKIYSDGVVKLSEILSVTSDNFENVVMSSGKASEGLLAVSDAELTFKALEKEGNGVASAWGDILAETRKQGKDDNNIDTEGLGEASKALIEFSKSPYDPVSANKAAALLARDAAAPGGGGLAGLYQAAGNIEGEDTPARQAYVQAASQYQMNMSFDATNKGNVQRIQDRISAGAAVAAGGMDTGTLGESELQTVTDARQAIEELEALYASDLAAYREYTVAKGRMQRDHNRQMQYMSEDFIRQTRYAQEDHARQLRYMEEDYNRQVGYATEDYLRTRRYAYEDHYRSERYAAEDYQRQRKYSYEDHNRQLVREARDWAKQMARAGEDMARGMADPFVRMTAEMTWSMRGFLRNIKEQNRYLLEQQENLDKLRSAGVSQEAIDLFGLSDPSKARQLGRLVAGLTDEAVKEINSAAGTRGDLGDAVYAESVEAKRAADDRKTALADAEQDFATSVKRMEEQYQTSVRRVDEQFATSLTRMNEQFATSMGRMEEQYTISLTRSEEAYKTSVERSATQFSVAVSRAQTALNTSLGDMKEDLDRSHEQIVGDLDKLAAQHMNMTAGLPVEWKPILVNNATAMGQSLLDEINRLEGDLEGHDLYDLLMLFMVSSGKEIDINVKLKALMDITGWKGVPWAWPPGGGAGGEGSKSATGGIGSFSAGFPNYSSGKYHGGQDIAAPIGTPVYATQAGKVESKVSLTTSYGKHLKIGDSNYDYFYAHMNGFAPGLKVGDMVNRGQHIGFVGSTGNSTGPHLHFEVRPNGGSHTMAVDPRRFMKDGGVALGARMGVIAEAGPEAVVPLSGRGAQIVGEAIGRHVNAWDARRTRVSAYSTPTAVYHSHVSDHSTRITGPISVVSNDPNEMGRRLAAKARRQRMAGGRP